MRICIFTHTFPRFTGDTAAPFMGNLAEALSDLGHKVVVLAPYDQQIKKSVKRKYELRTYRYIFPDNLHILGYSRTLKGDKSMSLGTYLLSPFLYLFGFLALLRLVRREKIDIVSSHWIIPNGFIASLLSKIMEVPFTTTIPGSDVYLGSRNFLFRVLILFAARNAKWVISDSQYYLQQLYDLGFRPEKTAVIRYGVNMNNFKPTEKDRDILKRLGLTKGTPTIVAVGRMVSKKGFVYLIEAMPKVLKSVPAAKLVLVGDGDERKNLEQRTKDLGVKKAVMFAGTISYDELSKYYNIGDVFVMPSIRDEEGNIDASPVAMMEAMACGTPVVATRFSGSSDLVEAGKTGYLAKEKDSAAIANSIVRLLSKKNRKQTQRNVRKIAVSNFSTRSVATRYIEIFKEVLTDTRRT